MSTKKDKIELLQAAKTILKGYKKNPLNKENGFICWALRDAAGNPNGLLVAELRNEIQSRIFPRITLEGWIKDNHPKFIPAQSTKDGHGELDRHFMLDYRMAYIDLLIEEVKQGIF